MAEKYELDRWAAVVCNGFTAVNVMSSGNVEELGWDYTEMELDPTGTCGLFDGMLLDWDDDTPAERRDHEAYFPDAFTVGARILADDWDHELGNNEVRSRCFAIIEDADQFTDHDTARDWLCESTMADFSEVEARTFFQNLTLMDSEEIAKLDGRPIIPSAGADECRAAVLAFNERMVPRRHELGLGDTAVVGKTKKSETTSKVVPMKKEQAVHGLGRVDFSGLGYGWGTGYPDSLSVDAIGIDFPSGEHNIILNFSPITHAPDVDGRKLFCHETTIGYDLNADSWSGATIGPDFWTLDGKEAREFAENIGLDRLAARVRQARHRGTGAQEPRSAPDPQGHRCRTRTQRSGGGGQECRDRGHGHPRVGQFPGRARYRAISTLLRAGHGTARYRRTDLLLRLYRGGAVRHGRQDGQRGLHYRGRRGTGKDEGHLRASRSEGLQPCRYGRRGQEDGRGEAIG